MTMLIVCVLIFLGLNKIREWRKAFAPLASAGQQLTVSQQPLLQLCVN